jgi:CubicO group peptidase (beta-lactamase class C family)
MKPSIHSLPVIILGLLACVQTETVAEPPLDGELPLRLSEPVEAIIVDLNTSIPEHMRREDIPGAAIALIDSGRIVWKEGFGITNAITGEPVTQETLFEVASNSKIITAYVALRLVDRGELSLDKPLNAYLSRPWLPPSPHRNAITLRHVLSHTAGLGASVTLNRESLFPPGHSYYYSGIGFMYLQEVIEEITGQSLEVVAQEMVFEPLGMSSSSFVSTPDLTARTANGHLRASIPALLFTASLLVSMFLVAVPGLLVLRIRTGRWRPRQRMVITAGAVAYALSLLPALILLGRIGLLEFVCLIAICGFALVVIFVAAMLFGRVITHRLFPGRPNPQAALMLLWSLFVLIGLVLIVRGTGNLPVPKWPPTSANAAGTVRATAGDLATFLIEISNPRHLSPEMAAQLRTPQVTLSRNLSWGLGPGIQHGRQGDAIWQWGQHLDFQSVMIIYPEAGFGVAVCTNNDLLNPDVAVEIAHRALGGRIEPILRAVHLGFNYEAGS